MTGEGFFSLCPDSGQDTPDAASDLGHFSATCPMLGGGGGLLDYSGKSRLKSTNNGGVQASAWFGVSRHRGMPPTQTRVESAPNGFDHALEVSWDRSHFNF